MKQLTLYRYDIEDANWGDDAVTDNFLKKIATLLEKQPFRGAVSFEEYGFIQCGYRVADKVIYGKFIQKFSTIVTDYDTKTKAAKKEQTIDSGEYLFLIIPSKYELFLQTVRSPELPKREYIEQRFIGQLKLAFHNSEYMFGDVVRAEEEINRDEIVRIFYEEADKVTEVNFRGFDENLIQEERKKRNGKIQTYFNPIEEYQEAGQESSIRAGKNIEHAIIKAKKDQSLKKDPTTRVLLEASRKPTIKYEKQTVVYEKSAVRKVKEVVSVSDAGVDLTTPEQIAHVIDEILYHKKRETITIEDEDQTTLFDD